MRKLFIVFLYLVILSSVFSLRTCWTSGDPAETVAEEAILDSPGLIDMALEHQERQ